MIRFRPVLLVPALALAVVLPACGSSASSRVDAPSSRDADDRPVDDGGERRVSPDPADAGHPPDATGPRVDLGVDATQGLEDFLTAPRLLLGDVVEIDMSRKPFFGRSTMSISARDVERTEHVDGARGVLTITLTNTSGYTTVLDALPSVRIGDGFEVYATQKIVLRYWTRQTVDRPVHFHGVARGGPALISEGEDAEPRRGAVVELNAEVRSVGDGYRFERWAEVKK